jgi:predicted MarR family transcription regulator
MKGARGAPAIVSSAHLVSEKAGSLSQFEFGLIVASNAFNRWIVRCMAAAGQGDLAALDVLVLHSVHHRGREKKLADLCFILNIEEPHTVTYSLKKLVRAGLISGERRGKEIHYGVTEAGEAACLAYREVREACLIDALDALSGADPKTFNAEVAEAAGLLRALSGLYDQAARGAASL